MSPRPARLPREAAAPYLAQLPAWAYREERGGLLYREFVFHDFAQAFAFMTEVAAEAERRDHHPEWFNVYNRVQVTLTTHDAQGLSMRDIEMAQAMDRLAASTGHLKA